MSSPPSPPHPATATATAVGSDPANLCWPRHRLRRLGSLSSRFDCFTFFHSFVFLRRSFLALLAVVMLQIISLTSCITFNLKKLSADTASWLSFDVSPCSFAINYGRYLFIMNCCFRRRRTGNDDDDLSAPYLTIRMLSKSRSHRVDQAGDYSAVD